MLDSIENALQAILEDKSYPIGEKVYTKSDRRELELMYQLYSIEVALSKILLGAQEYSIGPRRFKRADVANLRQERRELEVRLSRFERGGMRVRQGVPN